MAQARTRGATSAAPTSSRTAPGARSSTTARTTSRAPSRSQKSQPQKSQPPPKPPRTDQARDDSPLVARWRRITALVLSILGFADSLYLTIDHYTGALPICVKNSVLNCQKVTTSTQSMLFGIFPVALLGLLFFTAMVVVNLPPFWRRSFRWAPWSRLVMVVGGMGFVLYLIYSEVFTIGAVCLYCTGVHAVTFLLFLLIVTSVGQMFGEEPAFER